MARKRAAARDQKKAPAPGEVLVRMYRQGLGDCFLLTFRGSGAEPCHVLIDCGVWDRDAATRERMRAVVDEIAAATASHLSLLIVTHEHWDHVSGFLQEARTFANMTIDEVWLAWTENPTDALAKRLKREYAARREGLRVALQRIRASNAPLAATIDDLLGLSAGPAADPAAAMDWLRSLKRKGTRLRYCTPGDLIGVPGTSEARAFVLGPPRDPAGLRRNNPTARQTREGDAYLRAGSALADDSFFVAAAPPRPPSTLGVDEQAALALAQPFDTGHQIPLAATKQHAFFQRTYHGPGNAWRRVDEDWLSLAAELALWLDGSTNNTSLVLAFELASSGGVLLFVGDAQVGNWMSWESVTFDDGETTMTAADLVARTVLYKVGHHGSHNATLRRHGLERMTSEDLVAMIPVERRSVEKKGWKMPYEPMYRALVRATRGRILRADDGIVRNGTGAPTAEQRAFAARVKETPLYLEYRVR